MFPLVVLWMLSTPDGARLYQERKFVEAESALRRALAAHPGEAQTRLYLARTLIELGRIPEALAEIERVVSMSADAETQFQAGKIIRQLAERRFAALERLAPDSAAVKELAGRRFELEGKVPEALREYRAAIAKEPTRPGLHFEAGNMLWRLREMDSAAAEFQAELARMPYHGMANLRLGQVYVARNEEQRAAPFLERAVGCMPESADAKRELGKVYSKMGRLDEARTLWETVAKAHPDDDQVHYLLGNLYRQLGKAELARRELEKHRTLLENRRKRD
jgi:protein O-GlcNAc transferase